MQYVGVRDGRVFVTTAESVDDAHLNIGEVLNGHRADDPGNVDLDFLGVLMVTNSKTVEVKRIARVPVKP